MIKLLFHNIPLGLQMQIYDDVAAKVAMGGDEILVVFDNVEHRLKVLRKGSFIIVSAEMDQP